MHLLHQALNLVLQSLSERLGRLDMGSQARNLFIHGPVRHFWTYSRVEWTRMHNGSGCFLQTAALRLQRNTHQLRLIRQVLVAASLLPAFLSQSPRDRRGPCCSHRATVDIRGITNCAPLS